MKKIITVKRNEKDFLQYKNKFTTQKDFPLFTRNYTDRIIPIMHAGYLIFIRSKFIYLGIAKGFEERNLYVSWVLLKAYWENVAFLGYYYLSVKKLLDNKDKEKAFELSRKMALGGRGFLTEEMVKKRGRTMDDFNIPSIYTMIDTVDKDFKNKLGKKDSMMRELYDTQVAEGGHTTYLGLNIAGRWLKDGSGMTADIKKSWTRQDYSEILNLSVMASLIFFIYWDKFETLRDIKQ